jgi:hypothetical protein
VRLKLPHYFTIVVRFLCLVRPGYGYDMINAMKNVCSVDDCGKFVHGRGLCDVHYRRYRLYGDASIIKHNGYRSCLVRNDLGEKKCRTCCAWYPEYEFNKNAQALDALHGDCRNCSKKRSRAHWLSSKYGLHGDAYEQLLVEQCNSCPCCYRSFDDDIRPCVDHDHECCPGRFSCGKCVSASEVFYATDVTLGLAVSLTEKNECWERYGI